MRIFKHTEPGGKKINEDFLIVRRHPDGGDRYVCILADGQGGQPNGAEAARTACETAWKLAAEKNFDQLLKPRTWLSILEQADFATAKTGGFTTLVAMALDRNFACGASCGDSKAYFAPPSLTSEMVEWTAGQSRNPLVGSSVASFSPFLHQTVGGGRVIIVSDGVWKYCGYESLQEAFRLPDSAFTASLLRASVILRSGRSLPDDFTVIAIDID